DPQAVQAKFGYALDSNGKVGDIIVAAPTQAKLFTVIKGKTAHAGVAPEEGISAITLAAKAVAKMPLGRIDDERSEERRVGKEYRAIEKRYEEKYEKIKH